MSMNLTTMSRPDSVAGTVPVSWLKLKSICSPVPRDHTLIRNQRDAYINLFDAHQHFMFVTSASPILQKRIVCGCLSEKHPQCMQTFTWSVS